MAEQLEQKKISDDYLKRAGKVVDLHGQGTVVEQEFPRFRAPTMEMKLGHALRFFIRRVTTPTIVSHYVRGTLEKILASDFVDGNIDSVFGHVIACLQKLRPSVAFSSATFDRKAYPDSELTLRDVHRRIL